MGVQPDLKTLGGRVKQARMDRDMTQVVLAAKAGIKQPALSAIEANKTTNPRAGTLLRLAMALQVEPRWLQSGEGSRDMSAYNPADHQFTDVMSALDPGNRRSVLIFAQALLADRLDPGDPDLPPDPKAKPSRRMPYPLSIPRKKTTV